MKTTIASLPTKRIDSESYMTLMTSGLCVPRDRRFRCRVGKNYLVRSTGQVPILARCSQDCPPALRLITSEKSKD